MTRLRPRRSTSKAGAHAPAGVGAGADPGNLKRPKLTERPVQRALLDGFAWRRCHAVHVPNGSHLAGDKLARVKQVAALKADGFRAGFPDLIIIDQTAPRVGFVEVKREGKDELDPEQIVWRDQLQAAGLPWALANDPDAAGDILRAWGWR